MTSKTLMEIFDNLLSHLKFNKDLYHKLYHFHTKWTHKNEDHMNFFGGQLTGIQVVRFTPKDTNIFFSGILNSDIDDIADEVLKCRDINQDFSVSSDTFNITSMYLIHRFLTSEYLNDEDRERAAITVAMIFNCRILTSLLSHYFKYPANEAAAKAAYANLNYKYLIKKLGSWNEVIQYRSKEMVSKESIHYTSLVKFSPDLNIVYVINDSQGRIRDLLKNIYASFKATIDRNEKINTSSSTMTDTDGIETLNDKTHGMDKYVTYGLNIIPDTNSFIKKELTDIVLDMMHTCAKVNLIKTLNWISDNLANKAYPEIEEFVKLIIVHSYEFLNTHSTMLHNPRDLSGFLSRLRGAYLSSRTVDPDMLKLRDLGLVVVKDAIRINGENTLSATRSGVMLYIVLRTFTKDHYVH